MEIEIHLDKYKWIYDDEIQLGTKGGFGEVFEGYSEQHGKVAIKRLNLQAQVSAHRELEIASYLINKTYEHIIPVFDSGIDAETGINYVVMAKGDYSLKDEISTKKTRSEREVVCILIDIVKGLEEGQAIVHRDLKPGNIIFHEDRWKIADFGIAKFIEDSTSSLTLQGCLSPQYAAPEQWKLERVSHETDIYAFGCIGFELINGQPPFQGDLEELKSSHISKEPPEINTSNPKLKMLISICLRKNSTNRPSIKRVNEFLQAALESDSLDDPVLLKLSEAAEEVFRAENKQEVLLNAIRLEAEMRSNRALGALKILDDIFGHLINKIEKSAPNVNISDNRRLIVLGNASIILSTNLFQVLEKGIFKRSGLDILLGGMIRLNQNQPKYIWSANLWYGDLGKNGEYRWWECAYMDSPFVYPRRPFTPFAVDNVDDADKAASTAVEVIQYAIYPKMIDDECQEAFIKRWVILFTHGVKGELLMPAHLPIENNNSSDYLT